MFSPITVGLRRLLGEERDYIVYHAYDANAGGAPTLRISELAWESDGWPTAAGP